jgi:transposase-like protein
MKISPEILKRLEKLPDACPGTRTLVPTEEQMEILRLYYRKKRREDLATVLGVSPNTMRKWYRHYVEGKEI